MADRQAFVHRIETFSAARRALANAALAYTRGRNAAAVLIAALLLLTGILPWAVADVALAAAGIVYLFAQAIQALRLRQRFGSHLGEAFRMEALAGGRNSRLVSAWDFLREDAPTPLMRHAIDAAAADLPFDYESRLDRRPRDHARKRFAVAAILLVLLGLTPWCGFHRLAAHMGASLAAVREMLFPVRYELVPGPGRHVFRVGQAVPVRIDFATRRFAAVTMIRVDGETREASVLPVDAAGDAGVTIRGDRPAVSEIRFAFGGRETEPMTVAFADPPALESMQAELVYPAYTRMLPRTLEGVQERFYALAGTKITLGFAFTKELREARIVWEDGDPLPLDVTGRFASTRLLHGRARAGRLEAVGADGFPMEPAFPLVFDLQADEAPRVALPGTLKPEMPTLEEGMKLFGFGVRCTDDFGVSRCVLSWSKSTVDDPTAVTQRGEVERLVAPPRKKVMAVFDKVFADLAVEPGDRIAFRVEVYDNRRPDAQMGRSVTRALFVYQKGLEDLAVKELGFGQGGVRRERLAKSKRATSVVQPAGSKYAERVRNEWDAELEVHTRAPSVAGDHAGAVRDYFRLLTGAVAEDADDAAASE